MKLFDEMPYIESEDLILRPFRMSDAESLAALTRQKEVYRYLPTFLYELKYDDKALVIERMEEECFLNKDSILLAICDQSDPQQMEGIAEIYNYEPEKEKASIGYRLMKEYWGRGIASKTAAALKEYLFTRTDVRKITAHVMCENMASRRVLEKNGFERKWTGLQEDWGFDQLLTIDKYIVKKEN